MLLLEYVWRYVLRDVATIDHSPGAHDEWRTWWPAPRTARSIGMRSSDGAEALAALAIFSIAHRFVDLRHLGVSVDRLSYKDSSAKQG